MPVFFYAHGQASRERCVLSGAYSLPSAFLPSISSRPLACTAGVDADVRDGASIFKYIPLKFRRHGVVKEPAGDELRLRRVQVHAGPPRQVRSRPTSRAL
ncbi:hypothetical protein HPB50_005202 [Hyalomma asiaticum]|uniref:Uncharacterized protein n=1 Tax=Hyalomma asiaticum TaxID=266040 RepID=A0ACB7TCB6_HYAAI|nr:hypothetical protein HPB50_005202 [Hyalomma asiaticum]